MTAPSAILKDYWGFSTFKGSQEQIIAAVLEGNDVLALMPTGGGKSVCYQVPALAKEGICIVVSPLIALIQDQVANLKQKEIKAVALIGGLSFEEVSMLLDNCIYGNYKFLYLSPERLSQELVKDRIARMNVNLIAIDEVHCISQWGNDFRPAYLECGVLRDLHPNAPTIALTATATPRVVEDIVQNLKLEEAISFKDSFSRNNIVYQVITTQDKRYSLRQLCAAVEKSGIVYVRTRRSAEELSSFLNKHGITAGYFHGGLDQETKKKALQQWLSNTLRFMVATNAFGMGVDKPDVALVVHYHIPDSLENYFQESGRAGRNGLPATAVIITNENDEIRVKKQFLSTLPQPDFIKLLYKKLNNFFQIPYGTLPNDSFRFSFNEFCEVYELNTILAYNGLRLLDQNSVISLSQAFSRRITVRFLASKDQIFNYLEHNKTIANAVQIILRTYGGIFDHDTKVNTLLLAKKTGITESELISVLERLQNDEIIDYQAQSGDMEITFLLPREDDFTINTFAKRIKGFQEVKKENVQSMLSYIKNTRTCRNRQLLTYFGEVKADNCGKCDVCQSTNNKEPYSPEEVKKSILQLLEGGQRSSRKLIEMLPYQGTRILEAIQLLLEDRKIAINAQNEYILNQ